jgi:glycosyltransferase involved in cell wall biosynthesis
MNPLPEISVILSTYNRNRSQGDCPSLFRRAIDSILAQTFTNFELVLIDDASIDGTPEHCKNYAEKDPRIKFIPHQLNTQFPAKCYNEGMGKSRGRFIAFMFDDDVWLPHALQDLHDFFLANLQHNPQLGMVYGLVEFFDIKDNVMIDPAFGREWDLKLLFQHNYLANCAVLLRRDVIDVIGGYDEHPTLRRICDWDLWKRIGRKYSVKRLEKLVAKVYHHNSDSLCALIEWNPEKANKYCNSRTHFPLKCKITPLPQQWNYLKSYFTLNYNFDLTPYKHTFFHYIRPFVKKFLQLLGCWNIAKKLYSKLLKHQE